MIDKKQDGNTFSVLVRDEDNIERVNNGKKTYTCAYCKKRVHIKDIFYYKINTIYVFSNLDFSKILNSAIIIIDLRCMLSCENAL